MAIFSRKCDGIRQWLLVLAAVSLFFGFGAVSTVVAQGNQKATVTGTVVETMNVASYTYMLVENNLGKEWVAIPHSKVKKGQQVIYYQGQTMKNFPSKALGRTFERIVFSEGLAVAEEPGKVTVGETAADPLRAFDEAVKREGETAVQQNVQASLGEDPGGSSGAIAPKEGSVIEKAAGENSYRVNEIYLKAAELDKKIVRIRGKVVKVNQNIMGRHWLHVQDGSGNPMKNSHDLVVTTLEDIHDGTIITLEGVVAAKKDFGAGYKYEVIVEEAKVISE